eukprot:5780668-Pleurochrysis_carterae.AAC.1
MGVCFSTVVSASPVRRSEAIKPTWKYDVRVLMLLSAEEIPCMFDLMHACMRACMRDRAADGTDGQSCAYYVHTVTGETTRQHP